MEYVSLVIISHSEEIASGLRELLRQVHKDVKIAVAGGFDGGIGTDPLKIKAAIESVYSEVGVAIFFDLGSAFMNAEVAIELLDGQANVKIADAPLSKELTLLRLRPD